MTDQLDAVARAAKQAYDNYVSSTLGETRWTAEWIAESWRVIARAAIDALGLTEEWRCIGWVSTSTEKTAWLQRQS
ncbi:hypothetical protein, partial [Mycobacterium paragordonae]|uniref:hypothetical protein n=1 Tax=Mycobacterium paragordonae TaxID=1389713 RepID=UPI00105D8F16